MAESCDYNCTGTWPPYTPDNDITGIGVLVNYVATAGLSVLMITIYYVAVHDPSVDPFEKAKEKAPPTRPNPVDDFLLKGLRSGSRYLMKRILGSHQIKTHFNVRLEQVLVKIVTGFAILLRGFAQLQCGLEALKWRAILNLAWFSCLTHLSCLTMLRGYLYAHTFERLWRLFTMGALATLLAIGLLFTANAKWDRSFGFEDNIPTLCIIGCSQSRVRDSHTLQPLSFFWTPVTSAIFVVVAFVSRVVRLHKSLSVGIFGRANDWLDFQGRRLLWVLFKLLCTEGDTYSLKRSLTYRPLFGAFMTLRLLLDLWASFAFEIAWGCLALAWGIWRLLTDLVPRDQVEFSLNASKEEWTFGQLVSVIMLMAPLISIIGTLNDTDIGGGPILQQTSKNNEPIVRRKPESLLSRLPIGRVETRQDTETPNTDWDSHDSTLGTAIAYCAGVYFFCTCAVFMPAFGGIPLVAVSSFGIGIPIALYDLYCVILCSLTIELAIPQNMHWFRRLVQSVSICLFLLGWLFCNAYFGSSICSRSNLAFLGVYVLCALVHKVIGWTKRRTNR